MSGLPPTSGRSRGQRIPEQQCPKKQCPKKGARRDSIAQRQPQISSSLARPESQFVPRQPMAHTQHSLRLSHGTSKKTAKHTTDTEQKQWIMALLSKTEQDRPDFTQRASGQSYHALFTTLEKIKILPENKIAILQFLQRKITQAQSKKVALFYAWNSRDFSRFIFSLSKIGLLNTTNADQGSVNKIIVSLMKEILEKIKSQDFTKNVSVTDIEFSFYFLNFTSINNNDNRAIDNQILENLIQLALNNKEKLNKSYMLADARILETISHKIPINATYKEKVKALVSFILQRKSFTEDQGIYYLQFINYLSGISTLVRREMLSVEEALEPYAYIINNLPTDAIDFRNQTRVLRAIATFLDFNAPIVENLSEVINLALLKISKKKNELDNASIFSLYPSLSTLILKDINAINLIPMLNYSMEQLDSFSEAEIIIVKSEDLTKGMLNMLSILKSNKPGLDLELIRTKTINLLSKIKILTVKYPHKLSSENYTEIITILFIAHHNLKLVDEKTFKDLLYLLLNKSIEKNNVNRIWVIIKHLNQTLLQYPLFLTEDQEFKTIVNKLIESQSLDILQQKTEISIARKASMLQTLVSMAKNTFFDFSLFIRKFNEYASIVITDIEKADIEQKSKFIVAIASIGQAINYVENPLALIAKALDLFAKDIVTATHLPCKELSLSLWGLMGIHIVLESYRDPFKVIDLKEKVNLYLSNLYEKASLQIQDSAHSENTSKLSTTIPMATVWLNKKSADLAKPPNSVYVSKWQECIFESIKKKYPNLVVEQEKSIQNLPEVDILIPEHNLIIEVEGPSHYVADNYELYLTSTLLKKKLYTNLGYTIKEINLVHSPTIDIVMDKILIVLRELETNSAQPKCTINF